MTISVHLGGPETVIVDFQAQTSSASVTGVWTRAEATGHAATVNAASGHLDVGDAVDDVVTAYREAIEHLADR